MPKQILLIIGALIILAHVTLNINRSVGDANEVSYTNEATLTATGIAQSLLREVSSKAFDEKSIWTRIGRPDSLTSPYALGPEWGEAYPDFDDIDDYKGYNRTVSTGRLGEFTAWVEVVYTARASAGAGVTYPTFLKSVTVTVDGNTNLKNPVSLSSIIAY